MRHRVNGSANTAAAGRSYARRSTPGGVSLRRVFRRRKEAQARAQGSAEVVEFARSVVDDDGVISPGDVDRVMAFAGDRGFGTEEIDAPIPTAALRVLQVGMANRGQFVGRPDSQLLLKPDEDAYVEVAARLLKEVVDREFRGGSRGVSIPLGHGIRYRTGAMRGHMVTVGTHWQTADSGLLTVTNKRAVYHGARKNLEFAFSKLSTLSTYSDAITLGVSSRQNTSTIALAEPEFVADMIRAAYNATTGVGKPAATPQIEQQSASGDVVHLIEDTHTFEGDDGDMIWCGGLAPCTEDGSFIPEREHHTTHPDVLFCKVAGASHRHDALQAAAFAPGSQIQLRPEPDNAYDKNAVQIIDLSGELFVGYVPGTLSGEVSDLIRATDVGGQVIREFRRGSEQGERIGLHVLIAPAGREVTMTIHDADDAG
jgi:HIRAN domain